MSRAPVSIYNVSLTIGLRLEATHVHLFSTFKLNVLKTYFDFILYGARVQPLQVVVNLTPKRQFVLIALVSWLVSKLVSN